MWTGFCTVGRELPIQQGDEAYTISAPAVKGNGLNAHFGETIHCMAAEPHETFVRVSVLEGKQEVAFEVALLGRLRRGYRVFQLRGLLGTRIELCYMLVRIAFDSESNQWATTRQLRVASGQHRMENAKLKQELQRIRKIQESTQGMLEQERRTGSSANVRRASPGPS